MEVGLFTLKPKTEEFKQVEEYFYKSMNKEMFKITEINRYQNPIKYKNYYFNLLQVQSKLSNHEIDRKLTNQPKVIYGDKYNSKFNEYTPFEGKYAEQGEKWLFHVRRYQSLEEILGVDDIFNTAKKKKKTDSFDPDCGLLPLHTKNRGEISKIKTIEELVEGINPFTSNLLTLGDNALYFTINKAETLLYSHGKEHGFYEKNGDEDSENDDDDDKVFVQVLSRVATGYESDQLNEIKVALQEQAIKPEKFNNLAGIQKPDVVNIIPKEEDKNSKEESLFSGWYDSNCFLCGMIYEDEMRKLDERKMLPREPEVREMGKDGLICKHCRKKEPCYCCKFE